MKTIIQFLEENADGEIQQIGNIQILRIPLYRVSLETKDDQICFEELVSTITLIVQEHFHEPNLDILGKVLREGDIVISLCILEEKIIGCACIDILADKEAELFSVAIAEQVQGIGLGKALLKNLLKPQRKRNYQIQFNTQNPRIYSIMKGFCTYITPSLENPIIPKEYQVTNPEFIEQIKINPETGIISDYKGRIKKRNPICNDPEINTWFKQSLKRDVNGLYTQGFLFTGILDTDENLKGN